MFKTANFWTKISKKSPSTGFLPHFSPKVQVFFHHPPRPNNWTIYTSVYLCWNYRNPMVANPYLDAYLRLVTVIMRP